MKLALCTVTVLLYIVGIIWMAVHRLLVGDFAWPSKEAVIIYQPDKYHQLL